MMISNTWIPQKEIGPFILWSNELHGSLLKFTYTKIGGSRPEENDQFFYSRKSCEMAIENVIYGMMKRHQLVETMLTARQRAQLAKKIKNRGKVK